MQGRTRISRVAVIGLLAACGSAAAQDVTTTLPGTNPATRVTPGGQLGQPGVALPPAPPGGGDIELSAFSEAVDIKAFVEYVADALQINIVGNEALTGSVVFNAPVTVKREELLPLLDSLLEQHGFAIIRDARGFYSIQASSNVKIDEGTTRLIPTPGLRPTALREMIAAQLGGADVNASRVSFLDDLGVIVITDTPRRVAALESLIRQLTGRLASQQLMRFEVSHLAASVARDRIIRLVSSSSGATGFGPAGPAGQTGEMPMGADPQRMANLPDRLTVDPQGNALIFRGDPEEADLVERVIAVVDVPNLLETRQYFAGRAASSIADVARTRGLGEVQQIQTRGSQSGMMEGMGQFGQPGMQINPATGQPMMGATSAGASIVVDTSRGLLYYSGTPTQHETMAALLKEFNTEEEQIVVRTYKLNDADAVEVAELITGLLENRSVGTESGTLLPEQQGFMEGLRGVQATLGIYPPEGQPGETPEGVAFAAGQDIFVLADKSNNQVLVKAPAKLQAQFEGLIARLDLRKPQVYIEAKIVAVTANETFRLGFEYQLINAGGAGGALNFANGLGTFGDGAFTDPKQVNTGLSGITAAIIDSEYVPIIINALQRNVDTRVLATPQLLVDDNEPAEVASVEVQQTTVISQNAGTAERGIGPAQEAGTRLRVTPHISRGGYVRLEYEIEQSRFLGPSVDGIPADQLKNSITGDSVTVPQDTTVVVGGLRLSSTGDTIVRIPLLGDLPLIGHLFRDTNKNDQSTVLYVFLTPRILQEPTVADLTLLTRGPQAEVGEASQVPVIEPSFIEIVPVALPVPAGPGGREG